MNFSELANLFSYPFIMRAIIVGVLVSLCASLLGVILVLNRYSLIGHGLSDVGFASLSLAMAVGVSPLLMATPIVIITSFIIMYVSQSKKINGDVAIGIFSTGALAVGIIITALTKGFNTDVYSYMFGSILSMNITDVALSVVLSVVILSVFIIFYNRLFVVTADESFAKASGINVKFYQFLISFLTAITVVLGMRMMGTLLISSLIIFPAVTAKKIVRSFKGLMILSAVISVICFVIGILISFVLNIPTGAGIVAVNIVSMIIVSMVGQVREAIGIKV
ncbi:MAG: High-affinity zinc uptake system membrane protein ZnuB [Eubacteriales bacterium SKADARSKE-1]|nr:High-affinity zinc uptake system membrane protein ZnuB [Eubacteriales bacterium SKADARSKE-1]